MSVGRTGQTRPGFVNIYFDPAFPLERLDEVSDLTVLSDRAAGLRRLTRLTEGPNVPPQLFFLPDSRFLLQPTNPGVVTLLKLLNYVSRLRGVIHPDNIHFAESPRPSWTGRRAEARYRDWLGILKQCVNFAIGPEGNHHPRYVLYTHAGSDVATVMTAFSTAEVYILVDEHPFVNLLNKKTDEVEGAPSEANVPWFRNEIRYGGYGEIHDLSDENRGMFLAILAGIKAFDSNIRIRMVQYFVEDRGEMSRTIPTFDESGSSLPWDYKKKSTVPCHGVITFDTGDGTPVKTVFYLNAHVAENGPFITVGGSGERARTVDLGFVDGVFTRAALKFYEGYPEIVAGIAKLLRLNGGVAVEGREWKLPNRWPFLQRGGELFETKEGTFMQGARTLRFPHLRLSYTRGMDVTLFEQPSPIAPALRMGDLALNGGLFVFGHQDLARGLVGGRTVDSEDCRQAVIGDIATLQLSGRGADIEQRGVLVNETLTRAAQKVYEMRSSVRDLVRR